MCLCVGLCARNCCPVQLIVLARSYKAMEEESRSKSAKAERLLVAADARTKDAQDQVRDAWYGTQGVVHFEITFKASPLT